MANKVIPKAQERLVDATINWATDTIRVGLVRGYTGYAAGHQELSDITGNGGSVIATDTLSGRGAATSGNVTTLSCNSGTFGSVAAGAAANHVIVYKDTGTGSTSHLLVVDDTGTNLPVTPNGAPINYSFPSGVATFTSS